MNPVSFAAKWRTTLAFAAALICSHPAWAATVSINFDTGAARGTEATNLYVAQGVRFPSRPVIQREISNQVLQQGAGSACAPLVMEFSATMGVREVRFRAINRHLRAYSVAAYAGSVEVDVQDFFPRSRVFPLPPPLPSRDITLRAGEGEADITRVVATPPSDCFDLMVIDDLVLTTARDVAPIDPVAPPIPPNIVSVLAYELTQGVMSRLTRPGTRFETRPDTRLMSLPDKQLSFVAGRNTAVRFFLGASERTEPNFNANLNISVINRDGTRRNMTITENTVGGRMAPHTTTSDPLVQRRELVLRRARVNASLDYVIPAAFLANASSMRLILMTRTRSVTLARVDVAFKGPYTMGLNVFRIRVPSAGATPNPGDSRRMLQFFKDILPVSGDITLRSGGVLVPGDGVALTTCDGLLGNLSATVAATGAGTAIPDVNYWSNLFIARSPPGCGGWGYYNTPGALTSLSVSTAAQEIGHNIGINHASSQHGESIGRGDWEAWPYVHGSIGTVNESAGFEDGVFGVVMRRTTVPIDRSSPFGVWRLNPIAPCQASDSPTLFPACSAADPYIVHDVMSYGPGAAIPVWGYELWISDVNYYRVLQWFETCIALDPPHRFLSGSTTSFVDPVGACTAAGTRAAAASAALPAAAGAREALVFSGVILPNGKIGQLRVIRKMSAAKLIVTPPGPHTLDLRTAEGKVIRSIPFAERRGSGHIASNPSFLVVAPFDLAVHEAVLTLAQRSAQTIARVGPPSSITLLQPKTGETWRAGTARISWGLERASKQTEVYVQYSPNGGASWLPLGLVSGGTNYLDVNVDDLVPSTNALIYVSAADGLSTASAMSRQPFTITTHVVNQNQPD